MFLSVSQDYDGFRSRCLLFYGAPYRILGGENYITIKASLLHAEEPDALASTYYLILQNNDAEGWSSPSMYQPVGQYRKGLGPVGRQICVYFPRSCSQACSRLLIWF